MKKFISILAAGALMLSSASAFAAITTGTEVYTQNFDSLSGVANSTTIPVGIAADTTGASGTTKIPKAGYVAEDFGTEDGKRALISGDSRGTAEATDYALKFDANKSSARLKLYVDMTKDKWIFEQDLMIKKGGFEIRCGAHYTSYATERKIMSFNADGTIAVSGYTGSIRQTWEADKWYRLKIICEKSTANSKAGVTTAIELYDEENNLVGRWIGKSPDVTNGALATYTRRYCFVSTDADCEFYLDNVVVSHADTYSDYILNVVDEQSKTAAKEFSDITPGGKLTAELSFIDPTFTPDVAKVSNVLIASYDKDGRLLQFGTIEPLQKVDTSIFRAQIEAISSEAASVRAFVWNLDTFVPITDVVVVE